MREKRYSLQNGNFYDVNIEFSRPKTSVNVRDFGKTLGHDSSPVKDSSLNRCDSVNQDLLA